MRADGRWSRPTRPRRTLWGMNCACAVIFDLFKFFVYTKTMLTSRQKANTAKDFKKHDRDTGSAEVQIAILSRRIDELASHLKTNRKDNHSRRGLLQMVSRRKKFLNYLAKNDSTAYGKVVKKLGLKSKA